ncbi:MAG: DNA polymerase III subunit beta [Bacteroidales bacterium]|nr:DNA polymerase III subunit beta [Bacteroidales bacterium]
MNLIIAASELYSHLQKVGKVIPSKSTLPILTNVLFEIENNKLKLTGSDSVNIISTTIELPASYEKYSLCLEAKRLLEILKELNELPIEINFNKENLMTTIKTQYGEYTFMGTISNDYPKIPSIDNEDAQSFNINSNVLLEALNKTLFAVGNDPLRPYINGIYFDLYPDKACFVSTDIQKLVLYKRYDIAINFTNSFILSQKTASILKSLLSKDDSQISVTFDKQNVKFEINNNLYIIGRLCEGVYPAYNSVIPPKRQCKLTIDRNELLNSIKRVSLFGNPASNLIKFEINENNINISAEDYDLSTSATETIQCSYKGTSMTIGFKSIFLQEILSNIDSSFVLFEFNDAVKPVLIFPAEEDKSKEDTCMLIMPLKINE